MSKKPLHKVTTPLSEFDVSDILDHFVYTPGDVWAELLTDSANLGDPQAVAWAAAFTRRGASKSVLKEIAALVESTCIEYMPMLMPHGRFAYVPAGPPNNADNMSREVAYALIAMQIVNDDLVNRIRRCQLPDCRLYYFGDPRSKWCSTTCGSKARVRAKRKRDRQ